MGTVQLTGSSALYQAIQARKTGENKGSADLSQGLDLARATLADKKIDAREVNLLKALTSDKVELSTEAVASLKAAGVDDPTAVVASLKKQLGSEALRVLKSLIGVQQKLDELGQGIATFTSRIDEISKRLTALEAGGAPAFAGEKEALSQELEGAQAAVKLLSNAQDLISANFQTVQVKELSLQPGNVAALQGEPNFALVLVQDGKEAAIELTPKDAKAESNPSPLPIDTVEKSLAGLTVEQRAEKLKNTSAVLSFKLPGGKVLAIDVTQLSSSNLLPALGRALDSLSPLVSTAYREQVIDTLLKRLPVANREAISVDPQALRFGIFDSAADLSKSLKDAKRPGFTSVAQASQAVAKVAGKIQAAIDYTPSPIRFESREAFVASFSKRLAVSPLIGELKDPAATTAALAGIFYDLAKSGDAKSLATNLEKLALLLKDQPGIAAQLRQALGESFPELKAISDKVFDAKGENLPKIKQAIKTLAAGDGFGAADLKALLTLQDIFQDEFTKVSNTLIGA
ncbi:MAG: hypothetical protein ACAI44_01195, partial [Candidatus Sericytochromatia bacterium]